MIRTLAIDGSFLARSSFEAGNLAAGFSLALDWLRENHDPEMMVVAWDSYAEPKRRELYPEYKLARREKGKQWEQRDQYDEELAALKNQLADAGYTQLQASGFEADDVLATIARTWPGCKIIFTVDHDLLQLVDKETSILRPRRGEAAEVITVDNIVEKTGLTPKQHLDVATLAGCTGDGVPGLTKVGEVIAKRIIEACPEICDLLCGDAADVGDIIHRKLVAHDAKMAKYAELAIKERELVRTTRNLVQLYTVELEEVVP